MTDYKLTSYFCPLFILLLRLASLIMSDWLSDCVQIWKECSWVAISCFPCLLSTRISLAKNSWCWALCPYSLCSAGFSGSDLHGRWHELCSYFWYLAWIHCIATKEKRRLSSWDDQFSYPFLFVNNKLLTQWLNEKSALRGSEIMSWQAFREGWDYNCAAMPLISKHFPLEELKL